jgi:fatty acid desaturase
MQASSVSVPSHQQDLRDLSADLKARGLFEASQFWKWNLLLWLPTFFMSYFALVVLPFGVLWVVLAPVCSVALLTMGFAGHDAGHYALSRKPWVNDLWGQLGMTFMCGMSFGFWRSRHNQHHSRCQEIEGDPDMHFGVLFSVYPDSANWRTPLGRVFLRIQKWAFWPLSSLYWITLRYDGIRDLFQRPKETRIDRFLLPLHWIVLIVIPGLVVGWPATIAAYVTMSCLSSLMTASVFIPNHIGMRRLGADEKLSYLEQQITTSRNISNPRLLDFYYGGLNSQIEHHLFPRVSHDRYRSMRPIVRSFCEKRGIPYQEASLYRALASVGTHLGEMTAAYRATRTPSAGIAHGAAPGRKLRPEIVAPADGDPV